MTSVTTERPDSPELAQQCSKLFGVYVHVPFCSKKCSYCDFASYAGINELAAEYVSAVCLEIEKSTVESCDTAYVGGGTPTFLPPELLSQLLSTIPVLPDSEFTVEANPESLGEDIIDAIIGAGVNRISIGMQTSVPDLLRRLGRSHTQDSVSSAVELARCAGIDKINLDLIYGIPGETLDDWRRTISDALALAPGHISAYALTPEPGTPLWADLDARCLVDALDDDQAMKMELADAVLTREGYVRYEVSAWALPGQHCVHNLMYWGGGVYRGFGSGAHSHLDGRRFWNPRHPKSYLERGGEGVEGETITESMAIRDRIVLGCRRVCGLDLRDLPSAAHAVAVELEDLGLVEVSDDRLLPTSKGLRLNNEIILRLLSVIEGEC